MFAVIEVNKQQFRVQEGDTIHVDLMKEVKKGDKIDADRVLLLAEEDGSDVKIGMPYLQAKVGLTVVDPEVKGDKITVFKMKRRKRYRRTQGHRQQFTKVEVSSIGKATVKK